MDGEFIPPFNLTMDQERKSKSGENHGQISVGNRGDRDREKQTETETETERMDEWFDEKMYDLTIDWIMNKYSSEQIY